MAKFSDYYLPYIELADGTRFKWTVVTGFIDDNLPLGIVYEGSKLSGIGDSSTVLTIDGVEGGYIILDKVKLKTGYYLATVAETGKTYNFTPDVTILDKNGQLIVKEIGSYKELYTISPQLSYSDRGSASNVYFVINSEHLQFFTDPLTYKDMLNGSGKYSDYSNIAAIAATYYNIVRWQAYSGGNIFGDIHYNTTITLRDNNGKGNIILYEHTYNYQIQAFLLFGVNLVDNPDLGNDLVPSDDPRNPEPIPSPYDPAGPSTSGGGDGSFDNKSDPVDFTELPSLSVVNSGFAGLFKPTLSQLNALANYLWNEDINLDQLKKLVANPIDLLISLTIMPVDPPTAGSENIKVGFIDTGISINKIENQYMSIDFGSLEVKEYYGNALDYSPYTKISIYLPYIGLKQLNTDDVMKKTLALRYNVDLFTGACVAEIKAGESVLYTFTGNIANQIPLNAESFNSFLSGLIQAAASVGVAIASHGTSVATQGAAEAGEETAMAARGAQTASNLASMNAALTSAGAVATSKPDILHSGSMTANNGYLSGKTPYLIYEVPRACIPENYQTFVGYPSNIAKALSEVSGFTVVDSIHLENIPATDRELAEIERLLKGGVIL